jgi:hypothetical protein
MANDGKRDFAEPMPVLPAKASEGLHPVRPPSPRVSRVMQQAATLNASNGCSPTGYPAIPKLPQSPVASSNSPVSTSASAPTAAAEVEEDEDLNFFAGALKRNSFSYKPDLNQSPVASHYVWGSSSVLSEQAASNGAEDGEDEDKDDEEDEQDLGYFCEAIAVSRKQSLMSIH